MTFLHDLRRAALANFLPGLLLQFVALAILWAYYFSPVAHEKFNQLADFKVHAGLLFAFCASAGGGALFPFLLQSLQKGAHRRMALGTLPHFIVFWGARGWLVDWFYQLQSTLWGDNARWSTLLLKIVCDLGIFTPLVAIPSVALMYGLADSNFEWHKFKDQLRNGWYVRRVLPLVYMAWPVWMLALLVIYTLPQALQFPVQVIIQCFWASILVVLTDRSPLLNPSPPAEEPRHDFRSGIRFAQRAQRGEKLRR